MHRLSVTSALLALVAGALIGTAAPAAADTAVCDKFGSVKIQSDRYVVQNNEWGDNAGQCLNVTATGFQVTAGNHNVPTNGAPASYPSIYAGCHYGNCSAGSGLPLQVSRFGNVRSNVTYTTTAGQWDAAYDIWYDPTPNPAGQNTGAELMIWGSHAGAPQPAGSKVGTATLEGATWDVWIGRFSWNVISYVRQQPTNSLDVSLTAFTDDAANRGQIDRSWYLTSAQFGFEPWQGGPGLAVNSFGFTTDGGTTPPPPPATGQQLVGQASGQCLDVPAGQTGNGTHLQIWDCGSAANQRWDVRADGTIRNPNSGRCLEIPGGQGNNGTLLQLWDCWGGVNQLWNSNANGTITSRQNGRCLDAAAPGRQNGAAIQVWDCFGGGTQANQVWRRQ